MDSNKLKKKKTLKERFKVYGINTLGVTMIILAPIISPLPGPGGIPLLLGGFRLLAINNPWANKIYEYIKNNLTKIFPDDNRKIQILWDIVVIMGLIIGGLLLYFTVPHIIFQLPIFAIMTLLVIASLRNQNRFQRLLKRLKIKK